MLARAFALFVCLTVSAVAIARAEKSEPVPIRASLSGFPMEFHGWRGVPQPPFEPAILRVLGVDDYLIRVYSSDRNTGAGLYIGYYQSQRQGDTMHSPLNCLPGAGWEPLANGLLTVRVQRAESPLDMTINRYVVQKGLERQMVLYWYQAHGRVVASEYWSKFYLIRDAVRLNRTDGAIVRITTPILGDDAAAEGRAEQLAIRFAESVVPQLTNFLPE